MHCGWLAHRESILPRSPTQTNINKGGIRMKLNINSKNYVLKGYVKEEIEKRFEKLSKYFTDGSVCNVMITGEGGNTKKAEITVNVKNNVLRSEVKDNDLHTAIDKAVDRIEKQLIKHKAKLKKHNNDTIRYENITDIQNGDVYNIVKTKTFKLKPMTPEEACFQLELLEHKFYVFLNSETKKINVAYKRDDADYGLIEVEI
jgi:putative sigma-54 modulation protein